MNIGVIHLTRLLDESARGRALSERLTVIASEWNAKTNTARARLEMLRRGLSAERKGASIDAVHKLQREARLLEMELRQLEERAHHDVEITREQYRRQLLSEAAPHIEALAAEWDVDLVLTLPSTEIAFATQRIDLTDSLIARLS